MRWMGSVDVAWEKGQERGVDFSKNFLFLAG